MLTLQARVTLIAYIILMVAFFIPLKGDMDLLNKFGTSLIMLLPVSLSVYIINCMVTGSKAKLGLGCNAIAWIESLYILIIAVIILLYNLMNSKKDNVEDFYNFYGSSCQNGFYGSPCIISDDECDNIVTNSGSTCSIKDNMCVREITIETGSNCIGSQSYTEYEQCYGNDSNVCIFGSSSVNADYQTRSSLYDDLISSLNNNGTQFSNINSRLIERLTNTMTLEQISNLNTPQKLEDFLDSVNDIMDSGDYSVSNNQDIQDIISSSQIDDSNNDENNILFNFITAITDYGQSSDSFTYSAEPVGSDSDRYKYCINNVDFGNQDCIIVGPGIIEKD